MQAINIENLSFKYKTKDKKSHLKDISTKLELGKFHMVIGPNGSGKSTLVKTIMGVNSKYDGNISISYIEDEFSIEKNIKDFKTKEFAKLISYIPQQVLIPEGIRVKEFVSYGRQPHLGILGFLDEQDEQLINSAISTVGINEIADKFLEELSGGQRQKAIIAMALAQNTDIIILDEPTNNLDIKNQYETLELMHTLHLKGKTIIMIMHDLNQALQYADNIIIINNGMIVDEGVPNQVVTKEMLKNVFGVNVLIKQEGDKKYISEVKVK